VPSARPGGRAPHVWLDKPGGEKVSTIDLVGNGFVLLAGAKGQGWRAAQAGKLPIKTHVIADPAFAAAYGLSPDGAVLVRPDGHVAWRAPTMLSDPKAALARAADAVLGQ